MHTAPTPDPCRRHLSQPRPMSSQSLVLLPLTLTDESAKAQKMDDLLVECLTRAAEECCPKKWMVMPSGAAHDAQILAQVMPAAMLFIPSIGGISHSFAEDSQQNDIVAGCQVMLAAVLQRLMT